MDVFQGRGGAFGPRMDGWEGHKTHAAHSAGGTPESPLLGELAKGLRGPARPRTGRGHELSGAGREAGPASCSVNHPALL